jgi:hypothetical protein
MHQRLNHLLGAVVVVGFVPGAAAQPPAQPQPPPDHRQLVEMPPQTRAFVRQDMLGHLTAINEIVADLGKGDLKSAADTAESQLGVSTMGKYRGSRYAPGRFMPTAMRNMGWTLHKAASDFAKVARQGDTKQAYIALEKVTSSCIGCHFSFRTRAQQ